MTEVFYDQLLLDLKRDDQGSCTVTIRVESGRSQGAQADLDARVSLDPDALRVCDTAERYAQTLTEQLFAAAEVRECFVEAEKTAQTRGDFLRVVVRIHPSADDLHGLRWELLRHPVTEKPLATNERVLLSRFLFSDNERPVELRSRPQLRALVAIAAPVGERAERTKLASVDFEAERARAEAGLEGMAIEVLGGPKNPCTRARLLDALRGEVDVLYLVCHGRFSRRNEGEWRLILQNEAGDVDYVGDLLDQLGNLQSLPQLAILLSCESAGDGGYEPKPSIQQTLAGGLAKAGVAAVVAMQGRISMTTAERMMPVLLRQLQADGRVDRALAAARALVWDRHDAWMPALYSRMKSGQVFAPEPSARPLAERLDEAFAADPLPSSEVEPDRDLFQRDAQLAALHEALRESQDHGPRACVIRGDMGTGKTELARSFISQALRADPELIAVVADDASFLQRKSTYLAIREALKLLFGGIEAGRLLSESDAESVQRCRALTTELAEPLVEEVPTLLSSMLSTTAPLRRALAEDGAQEGIGLEATVISQDDLREQFCKLLLSLQAARPLLLVFENMQWVDDVSIGLLQDFLSRKASARVLFVFTYRPADLVMEGKQQHAFSRLQRRLERDKMMLPALDLDAIEAQDRRRFVDAFIDAEYTPNALDEDFRASLFEHTQGNPLFVRELICALEERSAMFEDAARGWTVDADFRWDEFPRSLESTVEERLSQLDDEHREILDVASVDGLTFRVKSLVEVLGQSERQLERQLNRYLEERHRLVEDGGVQRLGKQRTTLFRFSHPLVRQYIYDGLSRSERRRYHRYVAEQIEALYEGRLDEVAMLLAHHYEQTGDNLDAAKYLQVEARHAARVGANGTAIEHLQHGLELCAGADPEEGEQTRMQLELDLQNDLGAAFKVEQGWLADDTVQAYQRARELAEHLLDDAELARTLFGLWAPRICRGELPEATALATQCLAIGQQRGDTGIILQAQAALGNTLFWSSRWEDAVAACSEVLELFDPAVHSEHIAEYGQDPRVLAYMFLTLSLSILGRVDEALDQREKMLELVRELEHPFTLAMGLNTAVWVAWQHRDGPGCQHWGTELVQLYAQRHLAPMYLSLGQMYAAAGDAMVGRSVGRLAIIEKAWEQQVESVPVVQSIYRLIEAEIRSNTGDIDGALEAIEEGKRGDERQGQECYLAELLRMQAQCLAERDPPQSLELLEQSIAVAQRQGARLFEQRARAQLERIQG